MRQRFDVAIIGGGVIGSAIAYFLSSHPGFDGTIAVIERDPSYAVSSSSHSCSAIRQQFGTPPNIAMSAWSIGFLREAGERLATDDMPFDLGLKEGGYLFLGNEAQRPFFETRHAVQRGAGVRVALLHQAELAGRYPGLNTEDLAVGSLGLEAEGWFDGPGLHLAFRRKARMQGVTYLPRAVTTLDRRGGRLTGVALDNGDTLDAGTIVNAAGSWSGAVARLAGLNVPVIPRRRCIFVIESPAKIPGGHFLHDPTGVWVRPEGHLFLCGTTPAIENDPDDYTLEVDYALFDDEIWPVLAHRIPAFEQLRMLRAWAGLYDYNVFDRSAIIGPHPDIPNFIMANGFSGHGMMHAPAAGLAVAELIAEGRSHTLDIDAFTIERIEANRPIPEHAY